MTDAPHASGVEGLPALLEKAQRLNYLLNQTRLYGPADALRDVALRLQHDLEALVSRPVSQEIPLGLLLDRLGEAARLLDDGDSAPTETMRAVYRDCVHQAMSHLRAGVVSRPVEPSWSVTQKLHILIAEANRCLSDGKIMATGRKLDAMDELLKEAAVSRPLQPSSEEPHEETKNLHTRTEDAG